MITPVVTVETGAVNDTGVAWAAIFGGAFAAAGLTLVLSPLGAAFGLTWISPWHSTGEPDRTFTIMGAVWLIVMQWLSSGFGGYLTGRLRTKWPGAHTNEVFFRDTAHGFLAWVIASLLGMLVLVSVASHMAAASHAHDDFSVANGLFRSPTTSASASVNLTDQDKAESRHILRMGAIKGDISTEDRSYLVQLIVSHTGVNAVEAGTRIDNALLRERSNLKNASEASFFICLSLLIGAFIASAAGALGGMHRDVHYETGKLSL